MERLTDRYSDGTPFVQNCILQLTNGMADVIKKLAEYEDLEEKGLLKRLPVAEDSTVYVIDFMYDCKHNYNCPLPCYDAYQCELDTYCEHEYKEYLVREMKFNYKMIEDIGKTVFATKEEAEQKLKEMKGE